MKWASLSLPVHTLHLHNDSWQFARPPSLDSLTPHTCSSLELLVYQKCSVGEPSPLGLKLGEGTTFSISFTFLVVSHMGDTQVRYTEGPGSFIVGLR